MTTLFPSDNNAGISQTVACYGHSLMAGAGGTAMATLLSNMAPGRLFVNYGIGGQTTPQITARQGGTPIYVTINGNAFAGTGAIAVTNLSVQPLSTPADTTTRYLTGIVNGVRCILTRTAPGGVETYTLQPAFNSVAAVPAGSQFFVDDAASNEHHILLLWTARNDATNSLIDTVLPQIDACIAKLKRPKRFLVFGNTYMRTEATGSTAFNDITAFNAALEAMYGANYVSVAGPSAAEKVAINYTASSQSQAQIDAGRIPDDMYFDNTHLLTIGYQLIANRALSKFQTFGW